MTNPPKVDEFRSLIYDKHRSSFKAEAIYNPHTVLLSARVRINCLVEEFLTELWKEPDSKFLMIPRAGYATGVIFRYDKMPNLYLCDRKGVPADCNISYNEEHFPERLEELRKKIILANDSAVSLRSYLDLVQETVLKVMVEPLSIIFPEEINSKEKLADKFFNEVFVELMADYLPKHLMIYLLPPSKHSSYPHLKEDFFHLFEIRKDTPLYAKVMTAVDSNDFRKDIVTLIENIFE